jgi:hypothetical protein
MLLFFSAPMHTDRARERWTLTPIKTCTCILACRDGESLELSGQFGSHEPQGATSTDGCPYAEPVAVEPAATIASGAAVRQSPRRCPQLIEIAAGPAMIKMDDAAANPSVRCESFLYASERNCASGSLSPIAARQYHMMRRKTAALQDFSPVYARFGSFASPQRACNARGTSAMPPRPTAISAKRDHRRKRLQ